jgi:hypothetical protein
MKQAGKIELFVPFLDQCSSPSLSPLSCLLAMPHDRVTEERLR